MQAHNGTFDNISQRAVYSYVRLLAGEPDWMNDSQRDLHVFFKTLYGALYENPAQFGLPVAEDDCIDGTEANRTKKLADLNRKLQKPREMIAAGLDFLMQVGQQGQLAGDPAAAGEQMLLLEPGQYQALLKSTQIKKAFLSGLAGVGLEIKEQDACVMIHSTLFPAMLPALKNLALACGRALSDTPGADAKLVRFSFARCDFQVLDGRCQPDPLELYQALRPEQYERAARLHEYFTGRNYKPIVGIHDVHAWLVQYQGDRRVKSTPLFQMEYSERFQEPLRIQIKCASTKRIAPLMAQQPRFLQEDFFQRAFPCNGDACGWCKNRKNLGPSVIEFDGQQKTACWFANSDVKNLDDDAVRLIEQYEVLHAGLR